MDQQQQQPPSSHWAATWKDFNRALRKANEPFNPFVWIHRLVIALGRDVAELLGLSPNVWRRCVPVFAVSLIATIVACYFGKLQTRVVQPRWCPEEESSPDDETFSSCVWMKVHDSFVLYLTTMVLFHYVRAAVISPGYLITEADIRRLPPASSQAALSSSSEWMRWFWKTGAFGIDIAAEQELVARYGCSLESWKKENISNNNNKSSSKKTLQKQQHYHPDPNPSFCEKCQAARPPRCHHCSISRRCVLQYDHYCVWLNNCIGYNNVRSFVLVLFYVVIGCWYGILMLYKPFYEPLQEQLRAYGGLLPYAKLYFSSTTNASARQDMTLFDIPSLRELTSMLVSKDKEFPAQALIDLVFPFLLSVGSILAIFLGMHVKYILTARTTLEHRIVLDHQLASLTGGGGTSFSSLKKLMTKRRKHLDDSSSSWVNPFDQGSYRRNWEQIMGSNWLFLLLPVPVDPPPPYIPSKLQRKYQ